MAALRDLIEAPELHAGLLAGCAALIVCALAIGKRRTRSPNADPIGILGPALAAATIAALAGSARLGHVSSPPVRVVAALAALWLAGEVGARTSVPVGALLALAGGLALVDPSDRPEAWIALVVVLGPALGGTAAADLDRRADRAGLGPQLLAASILGLYACVPDTELVLALLGAMIPLLLLTWPRVFARLGPGGAYAAIGLYLWIASVGGAARPGSIVGAVAALALLVTEPVGRLVASRRRARPAATRRAVGTLHRGVVLGGQLLLAGYAARVVGRTDPLTAVILALPVVAIGITIGARGLIAPAR